MPCREEFRSKADSFVELIEKLTAEAVKYGGGLVVESSPPSIKKKVDVWDNPEVIIWWCAG